jgi:hypothetical protein
MQSIYSKRSPFPHPVFEDIKRKIRPAVVYQVIKHLEAKLWFKFDLLQNLTHQEMLQVTKDLEIDLLWQDCVKFLTSNNY